MTALREYLYLWKLALDVRYPHTQFAAVIGLVFVHVALYCSALFVWTWARLAGGGTMTATAYDAFLAQKARLDPSTGFSPRELSPQLFDFQRDITRWAVERGRAAIFADCGLGKTPMQLEWARCIAAHTDAPILILTPLAVAQQTVREGEKFGVAVKYARDNSEVSRITVTNYDRFDHFDVSQFGGVVLDESSILKAVDGATRTALIEAFQKTPYRLACTATPAPNDYMELGNHSEFLSVLTRPEMLATFFVHDGGETQSWRLKGHAQSDFWRWL